MAHNQTLGARGEQIAAHHLLASGMDIVARNWRCRYGELDLVARDATTTAFVEVKTRTGRGYGIPAEAVTAGKQQRIRRLAALWLAEHGGPYTRIRFDVVSVLIEPGAAPVVEHLPAVF